MRYLNIKKAIFKGCLLALFALCAQSLFSQNYWVYFTDKDNTEFYPESYFSTHTIQKYKARGINLESKLNYPVKPDYIEAVAKYADSVGYASRWFNALAVVATKEAISEIAKLPFVAAVEESLAMAGVYAENQNQEDVESSGYFFSSDLLNEQVETLGIKEWQKHGIDGKGVCVAVLDGGFPSWKTNAAFSHLVNGKRILKTWDFTKDKEDVDRGIAHGTMVLSCIAGMHEGKPMGLAMGASFLLAITEVRTEPFKEEQNWLAAAEWAHKNGADVINSSLGYTHHRYFTDQMDGKTSFVTRAANAAASQGILVVNAAGNEGSGKWKLIGAPADADSVLTAGGIEPGKYVHVNFSSYGPTYDKRLKPNVVAHGTVMAAGKSRLTRVSGTSFASPLIAGFVACAWQTDPLLTNMELFEKIEQSGHLYPYYDYAHGYGIPQPSPFLSRNSEKNQDVDSETTENEALNNKPEINIKIDNEGEVNLEVSSYKLKGKRPTDRYLYMHSRDNNGHLIKYFVFNIDDESPAYIPWCEHKIRLLDNQTVCVHFRGVTECKTYNKANTSE